MADSLQGISATFLCQPLDVLKTRLMNSHGEYRVSGPPYPPCCCLSSCLCASFCHPAPPTSSLTLSLQGVIHCATETAKLGPLAFYKVPGWGCMGWARLG